MSETKQLRNKQFDLSLYLYCLLSTLGFVQMPHTNDFFLACRRLLHDLCENMIDRSFSTLKEIVENYRELEQYSVNKLHEPQELFLLMEEHNLINQYHYDRIYGTFPILFC